MPSLDYIPTRPLVDDDPALVVFSIVDGEWTYTQDRYGDWRGTSGHLRTRLKFTLDWAKHDVSTGRLQRRGDDGFWIDRIHT